MEHIVKAFVLSVLIVRLGFLFTDNVDKSVPISTGIDTWEYHSVAINFAAYNKFPLMGVYKSDSIYQFNLLKRTPIEDYLFCRWSEAGWTYSFEKPPFYSLLLGEVYKIFGIDIQLNYYLNLCFLTLSIFMMFLIGSKLFPKYHLLLSFIAGLLYTTVGTFNALSNVSPDLLLTLSFLVSINFILKNRNDNKYWMTIGFLFALMILIKGNVIFFVFFYPLFLLLQLRLTKNFFKAISLIALSAVLTITPWMVYANTMRVNTQNYSQTWGEKLKQSENSCVLDISDFRSVESNRTHQIDIIRENIHKPLVTHLWSTAYAHNKFVIVSNQFRSEEFLSLHNEFSVNGEWKPEWRFRKDAYYNNNHLDKSVFEKIVFFYKENPTLFVKNIDSKIVLAIGDKFSFFCLAMALIGLYFLLNKASRNVQLISFSCSLIIIVLLHKYGYDKANIMLSILIFTLGILMCRKKHFNTIHFSLVLALLNSLLFVVVFYGGKRFIYFIDPLSILISLMIFELICFKEESYG